MNVKKPTVAQAERYVTNLGKRMRELRDERGLKRNWVAKQLGVHYNSLKNWELGNSRPGARELLHVARVYEIEVDQFFVGVKP